MIDLDAARKTAQEAEGRTDKARRNVPILFCEDVPALCKLIRDMADEIGRLRTERDVARAQADGLRSYVTGR